MEDIMPHRISQADTLADEGRWRANVEDDGTAKENDAPNQRPDSNAIHSSIEDEEAGIKEKPGPPPPARPTLEKLAQNRPKASDHLSITLGGPAILLFDIIIPCIIYYAWFDFQRRQWAAECAPYAALDAACPLQLPQYDADILGYAIISFGFGELYILVARVCRLVGQRELCAPLLSRARWELDATSWVYAVAMLCALVPFVVGSARQLPVLYLYAPGFLMAFLGAVMLATLLPVRIPVGINSQPRGTRLRPFIYYAAEDFIAVDGLQDRGFRERYNRRYDESTAFRRMFVHLTLWWIVGICVYLACLSAVIWTLEFHYAFGLSLGVLFAYILVWAVTSYCWVLFAMGREQKALMQASAW